MNCCFIKSKTPSTLKKSSSVHKPGNRSITLSYFCAHFLGGQKFYQKLQMSQSIRHGPYTPASFSILSSWSQGFCVKQQHGSKTLLTLLLQCIRSLLHTILKPMVPEVKCITGRRFWTQSKSWNLTMVFRLPAMTAAYRKPAFGQKYSIATRIPIVLLLSHLTIKHFHRILTWLTLLSNCASISSSFTNYPLKITTYLLNARATKISFSFGSCMWTNIWTLLRWRWIFWLFLSQEPALNVCYLLPGRYAFISITSCMLAPLSA